MVRSKDQLEKFEQLVKDKFMTQEQFENEIRGVDLKKLPQRISTAEKKENKKPKPVRAW